MSRFWADLYPYLRAQGWRYLTAFVLGLLGIAGTLAIPYFLRLTIDSLTTGEPWQIYPVYLLGAALWAGLLAWAERQLSMGASRRLEYHLRADLLSHLLSLDSTYFQGARVGDLMNRLSTDLSAVREAVGPAIAMSYRLGFLVLFSLLAMFLVEWPLALAVTAVVPVIFLIVQKLARLVDQRWNDAQQVFDQISAQAQENFSGIRVVKGFAIEDREQERFESLNQSYIEKMLLLARVDGPLFALMSLMTGIISVVVLALGGSWVIRGTMSLGELVQFNAYVLQLSWPLLGLGFVVSMFQRAITSWNRIAELLAVRAKIQSPSNPEQPSGSELDFQTVSLHRGGRPILDQISLRIPAGSTLGITGETGSGKTTLISLVPRLLDPDSGSVLLGGVDLRQIALAELRRRVALVPQEPFLFSESIAENIAFGLSDLDPERVQWAAELAGIAGDIEGFPMGYQTMLGERGVTLSGGQRQRVALARALAIQPEILILDDAMSAVDTETEARILSGLKQVLGQQTTLLISHRTSTLRYADWIVVLRDGRLIEEGTHESLLAAGGYYAELDRRQRLEAELS